MSEVKCLYTKVRSYRRKKELKKQLASGRITTLFPAESIDGKEVAEEETFLPEYFNNPSICP